MNSVQSGTPISGDISLMLYGSGPSNGSVTRSSTQVSSSGLELGQSSLTTPEAKIKTASKEFEALLIGQILKSARESGDGGWLGTDSEDADSSVLELAEQQIASSLSAQGGLGLGKLIQQGLTQAEKSVQDSPTNSQ